MKFCEDYLQNPVRHKKEIDINAFHFVWIKQMIVACHGFSSSLNDVRCKWIRDIPCFYLCCSNVVCTGTTHYTFTQPNWNLLPTYLRFIIGISDYYNVPDLMLNTDRIPSHLNYLLSNAFRKMRSQNIQIFLNRSRTYILILPMHCSILLRR